MASPIEILKRYWGYLNFRPLQEKVIDEVISGTDLLVLMPTGGGKSITFQVPGLLMDGLCLVVSPLIALIKDQVKQLKDRDIEAAYILSGMDKRDIDRTLDNCIYGQIKFLYVSPERLKTELFVERFKQMKISFIAIDEAHCISQWGYDFRPAYLQIAEIRKYQPKVGVLALTASATRRVVDDIQERLLFLRTNVLRRSFLRESLHYVVLKESNKRERLLRGLNTLSGSAIIYVRSRRLTREIADWLIHNNISALPYHAGLTSETKDQSQLKWQSDEVRVMVATNAFGMGIDKPNVRLVVHLDLPDSVESYFQEAGRAGRDGMRAHAVLMYSDHDIVKLRDSVGWNFPPIDTIKNVYQDLGNYFQLAIGAGKNETFDFNINEFSKRSDLKLFDIFSSLRILEREGYLQMSDSLHSPSKVQLKINTNELYYFEVANPEYTPLLKTLLRSYVGLFDTHQKINERLLANRLQIQADEVVQKLKHLNQLGLLEYIPANERPKIIWLTERLPQSHVHISYEQYGLLKERQKERSDRFIEYLETPVCRSKQLLDYFGEKGATDCGKCDVCLSKSRQESDMKTVENKMVEVMKKGPISLDHLLASIPKIKEDWALEILRYLADEGKVVRKSNNDWEWQA